MKILRHKFLCVCASRQKPLNRASIIKKMRKRRRKKNEMQWNQVETIVKKHTQLTQKNTKFDVLTEKIGFFDEFRES